MKPTLFIQERNERVSTTFTNKLIISKTTDVNFLIRKSSKKVLLAGLRWTLTKQFFFYYNWHLTSNRRKIVQVSLVVLRKCQNYYVYVRSNLNSLPPTKLVMAETPIIEPFYRCEICEESFELNSLYACHHGHYFCKACFKKEYYKGLILS